MKGYDFHFSFGGGTHHAALAVSELPECLTWLWRDYDPAKTEQIFEQSAEEKSKPLVPRANLQSLSLRAEAPKREGGRDNSRQHVGFLSVFLDRFHIEGICGAL